jgi:DNA polymerase-3 subunit gamma/tau
MIESIQYAPSPGKHRIFVVDEVHMLSKPAFNALLKTLEEPPPNSLFIFATTDPEKIPFTVISRCQRYDLRRIQAADVAEQLAKIAEVEGVTLSKTSLLAIAREGDGSMRDAQTLLDQLIAYGGNEISDETVSAVLDLIDRRVLLAIAAACIDGDAAAALETCGRAIEGGSDPKRLASTLVQLLRDLVVLAVAPGVDGLVEGSDAELAELRELVARSDGTRLRRMFRALVKEQEDLAWAPQPYAVLEMAIVRLATLPAGDDVARLLARLDALERKLSAGSGGGGGSGGGSASATRPARGGGSAAKPAGRIEKRASAAAPPEPVAGLRPAGASDDLPAHESAVAPSAAPPTSPTAESLPPARDAEPTPPAAVPAPSPPTADLPPAGAEAPLAVVFDRLRGFAQEQDRGGFASLEGGRLVERSEVGIRIEARNAFHAKRLRDRSEALAALCERFFGKPMQVEILEPEDGTVRGSAAAPDGARSENSARREEERKLRLAALQHPSVNVALEVLEASVVDIQPLGGPR